MFIIDVRSNFNTVANKEFKKVVFIIFIYNGARLVSCEGLFTNWHYDIPKNVFTALKDFLQCPFVMHGWLTSEWFSVFIIRRGGGRGIPGLEKNFTLHPPLNTRKKPLSTHNVQLLIYRMRCSLLSICLFRKNINIFVTTGYSMHLLMHDGLV